MHNVATVDRLTRQPPDALRFPFHPTAHVDRLIESVLPLVSERGDDLREGKTDADVVVALLPTCGEFTVTDAVLAIALMKAAENIIQHVTTDRFGKRVANPLSYAGYKAECMLKVFACHASASSATCCSARAHLQRDSFLVEEFGDNDCKTLRERLEEDMQCLRASNFCGERFADTLGDNIVPSWFERARRTREIP